MISQRCPKCSSKRIRRGYRPTPLWSKILFRYHLLCDNCNWEFAGFAVPGTVSAKPTKGTKKKNQANRNTEVVPVVIDETDDDEQEIDRAFDRLTEGRDDS